MDTSNVKPGTVVVWGAVVIGGAALAKRMGLFETGPDPKLPPDLDVPEVSVNPTLTRSYAGVMADRIFSAIYGSGGFWGGSALEDEATVVDTLLEVQNDADALLLVDAYGIRGGMWTLTGDLDLMGAVRTYLDADDIAAVNTAYRQRGMQFQW